MDAATFIRKSLYRYFRTIVLSDPIRNFAYSWAFNHLSALARDTVLIDVGCRDSLFDAFCAWQGKTVFAIERDLHAAEMQKRNAMRWNVSYTVVADDFLAFSLPARAGALTAIFALQHAGDADSACYEHGCAVLKTGGILLTVNECHAHRSTVQKARCDGDMRIYSRQDIQNRIVNVLTQSGMQIVEERYATADFTRQKIGWIKKGCEGNICFIAARKTA